MSIKCQGYSLTVVKGHSDFKVKCLTFGLYTQVRDSGPQGPLVYFFTMNPNLFINFFILLGVWGGGAREVVPGQPF